MKGFKILAMTFLLTTIFLVSGLFAGDGAWSVNARESLQPYGSLFHFTCTVDSLDTLTSSNFKLGKYDNVAWASLPFAYQIKVSSVLGGVKVTAYLQGSFDGTNWANVDTLVSAYTTETLATGTRYLNDLKRPIYRLLIYGVALNSPDTIFDWYLWAYQETY